MTAEDRALVDMIATKLMGWTREGQYWKEPQIPRAEIADIAGWNPLTSADDSKQVRDKLAELGYAWGLERRRTGILFFTFHDDAVDELDEEAFDADELRAVAEVARKVVERG